MQCFIDHIGLSLCAGVYESPASGIYINSLPGLSIESIDKIADKEQLNYRGVWNDVQVNALAQFRLDLMMEVQKCYQIDPSCDYDAMFCDNIEALTQAWKYILGVWVLLYRINSNRMNRYTTLTIDQARELRDYYQAEYEKFLAQGVKVMDTSSCELCCGGNNPEVVTWLP